MRTDLAAECLKKSKALPEGVIVHNQPLNSGKIELVEIISDEAEQEIGKPKGVYVTLELPPFWDESQSVPELAEAAASGLRQLLPEQGTVLVVGLGNREITPDALGPATAEQIVVTRHLSGQLQLSGFSQLRSVAALAPNVLGKTGMEVVETVRAVAEEIRPSALIVVDALASASLERLGRTVQIANTGIVPGSGVMNARKALNEATLHIPVIAVGIPTVVDLSNLCQQETGEPMMTTPRQIDLLIRRGANFLASVINRALHPSLSLEELLLLQS